MGCAYEDYYKGSIDETEVTIFVGRSCIWGESAEFHLAQGEIVRYQIYVDNVPSEFVLEENSSTEDIQTELFAFYGKDRVMKMLEEMDIPDDIMLKWVAKRS